MTHPFGLDLSQWQPPNRLDYARLSNQVEGVILRIGYGSSKDTAFERHYEEFAKLGVPIGAYHFPLDGEGDRQIGLVVSALKNKKFELGVWGDIEHPLSPRTLSKSTVDAYLPALDEALGVKVGVYTSLYKWREIMFDSTDHAHRPLWVANYGVSVPNLPRPWKSWALWQYTASGRLDGYTGNLDLNNRNSRVAIEPYNDYQAPDPEPEPPAVEVPYKGVIKPVPLLDQVGGQVVASIDTGKEVQVTEKAGAWVRVEHGWLEERWVEQVEKENRLYRARVITDPGYNLLVRALPHPEGEIVDRLPSGTVVDVLEELEGWLRIGLDSWVMKRWTERVAGDVSWLLPVPYYSQNDPRWRYQKLGTSQTTIGSHGCLVTGVASYMSYLGHAETPLTLNKKLTDNNGYQSGNLYYWNMPRTLYGNVHKTDDRSFGDGTGFEGALRNILNSRRPALAMVDFIPSTSGLDQHWVLMIGQQGNLFYLLDTWDGSVQALHAKYKKIFRLVGYTRQ